MQDEPKYLPEVEHDVCAINEYCKIAGIAYLEEMHKQEMRNQACRLFAANERGKELQQDFRIMSRIALAGWLFAGALLVCVVAR